MFLYLCFTVLSEHAVGHFTVVDLEGGTAGARPLYFFAEIGCLILCGHPRQKGCTKLCELTLKITIFSASEGAHPPQTPPVPTCTVVLSVLNWGAPSFEKSWIRPCFISIFIILSKLNLINFRLILLDWITNRLDSSCISSRVNAFKTSINLHQCQFQGYLVLLARCVCVSVIIASCCVIITVSRRAVCV